MSHAVFIQNPKSIYKDRPGVAYHFPKRYLRAVNRCVGEWVIFYESRSGAFGYLSVQRLREVAPDPESEGHYFAWLDPGSEWSFEKVVSRARQDGVAYEKSLRGADGRPMSGGANTAAVRSIGPDEFAAIVSVGLQPLTGSAALPREADEEIVAGPVPGFSDIQMPIEGAPLAGFRREVLTSRKARDQSFARQVKAAYGGRCAISGLDLRNGGGRAEVQAAHIRPVKDEGPDTVRNGLALSGTLHWMFDRGLISVAPDNRILVSHNKVSQEAVRRLIAPEMKLLLPKDPRHHPHPDYLRYHREMIFGQVA